MLFLIFFPSVPLPEKNLPIRMARGNFLEKKEVSQNKSRFRNFFFFLKKSIYFDEKWAEQDGEKNIKGFFPLQT